MKPILLFLWILLPLPHLFSQSVLLLNTETEKIYAPVLPASGRITLKDGTLLRGKILSMDSLHLFLQARPQPTLKPREMRKLKLTKAQRDSIFRPVPRTVQWENIEYMQINRLTERKRKIGYYSLAAIGICANFSALLMAENPDVGNDAMLIGSFAVFLGSYWGAMALSKTNLKMEKWKVVGLSSGE